MLCSIARPQASLLHVSQAGSGDEAIVSILYVYMHINHYATRLVFFACTHKKFLIYIRVCIEKIHYSVEKSA